jgi:hypothetical protein
MLEAAAAAITVRPRGTRKKPASSPSGPRPSYPDGLTPACRTIRELLVEIPRIWATEDPDGDIAATPAQRRAHRRVLGLRDKLDRLIMRLAGKRAHTMAELCTLVLFMGYEDSQTGFDSREPSAAGVIEALLRSLCGVDPNDVPEWVYSRGK